MTRLGQTLARIGFGFSAMGALIWVLWPKDWNDILEPESLFAFVTAVVLWILSEIKNPDASEGLVAGGNHLDGFSSPLDETDRLVILEFAELFTPQFRQIFSGSGFPRKFHISYLTAMEGFHDNASHPSFRISDEELDKDLKAFSASLSALLKVGQYAFDLPGENVVDVRPDIFAFEADEFPLPKTVRFHLEKPYDESLVWGLLADAATDCVDYGEMLLGRLRKLDPNLSSEIFELHRT